MSRRPSYEEFPPEPALAAVVVCAWERTTVRDEGIVVLPDGCSDVVWRSDGALFVAGPDRGPVAADVGAGADVVGIRLRPGAAASVLGSAVSELCDRRVPLDALWGIPAAELAERLADLATAAERRRLLALAVRRRIENAVLDLPVLAAVQALGRPCATGTDVAGQVGLSPRQLRRRFVHQVGYGPKTYERVMRFRRFLDLTAGGHRRRVGLATLAAEAGFADQAHLTRECRRLAGSTPAQLVGLASGGPT